MRFYRPDPQLAERLAAIVDSLCARHALSPADLAVLWLEESAAPDVMVRGAGHREEVGFYPASIVKLFYMVAVEEALATGRLAASAEVERALQAMIGQSANEATNYLIDLLTETTSGPELAGSAYEDWVHRRQAINRFFAAWDWPELKVANLCQKTMDDDRYGRERQFAGADGHNHNRLNALAVGRLIREMREGRVISPAASRRMLERMRRDLAPAAWRNDPLNQIGGFFGEGLVPAARLWSKAGLTLWTGHRPASWRRHDCAYIEMPSGRRTILVVFSEGEKAARNERFLPDFAAAILAAPEIA